ncbi:hypothetical protein E2320_008700 [Naja naja]|nr:hypothetical protein E2320_008700 [Naja naja]
MSAGDELALVHSWEASSVADSMETGKVCTMAMMVTVEPLQLQALPDYRSLERSVKKDKWTKMKEAALGEWKTSTTSGKKSKAKNKIKNRRLCIFHISFTQETLVIQLFDSTVMQRLCCPKQMLYMSFYLLSRFLKSRDLLHAKQWWQKDLHISKSQSTSPPEIRSVCYTSVPIPSTLLSSCFEIKYTTYMANKGLTKPSKELHTSALKHQPSTLCYWVNKALQGRGGGGGIKGLCPPFPHQFQFKARRAGRHLLKPSCSSRRKLGNKEYDQSRQPLSELPKSSQLCWMSLPKKSLLYSLHARMNQPSKIPLHACYPEALHRLHSSSVLLPLFSTGQQIDWEKITNSTAFPVTANPYGTNEGTEGPLVTSHLLSREQQTNTISTYYLSILHFSYFVSAWEVYSTESWYQEAPGQATLVINTTPKDLQVVPMSFQRPFRKTLLEISKGERGTFSHTTSQMGKQLLRQGSKGSKAPEDKGSLVFDGEGSFRPEQRLHSSPRGQKRAKITQKTQRDKTVNRTDRDRRGTGDAKPSLNSHPGEAANARSPPTSLQSQLRTRGKSWHPDRPSYSKGGERRGRGEGRRALCFY